jgi:hypothetical protein
VIENFGEEKIEVTEQDAIRITWSSVVALFMSCLSAGPRGEASRKTEIFKDDEPALTARIRLVMSQSLRVWCGIECSAAFALQYTSGSYLEAR